MGNSFESATTNKILTTEICFGKTKYSTTFRIMPSQPFDVILESKFIVAAEIYYNPVNMTINFAQKNKTDSFSMMLSGNKVTEWAPLILAAGVHDCLPSANPDIIDILRDVAKLFNPTPSVIKTDFSHQLRLTTNQPCRARMRRYSPEETRILREHIKELYQAGADGSSRLVINFRPLNKVTIRDEYPFPRIDSDLLAESSTEDNINSEYSLDDNNENSKIEEAENTYNEKNELGNTHTKNQCTYYKLINKVIYNISDAKNLKLYVPKSLVKSILFHHDDTPMIRIWDIEKL
ncbi:hypothetical protein BB561_001668 [Smittium simulii]|uniref:Uncharacterized protein n=1 Tax=Smittium simulii TaxID=133385 RepID=A0A2T9YTM5_9FUNG|nr:hypothetical protein BB561_001668 [Smittium simulii]